MTAKGMFIGAEFATKRGGKAVIFDFENAMKVFAELTDGFVIKTTMTRLRSGNIIDKLIPSVCGVGFPGWGRHKPSKNGSDDKKYNIWRAMIYRCYDKKTQEKFPTYKGCCVCDEWHNYQSFASWYSLNHPADGEKYDLDKDIKIDGNKIYSPSTCEFVSHKKNSEKASAKSRSFKHKDHGVVHAYNISKFCNEYGLEQANLYKVYKGSRSHHKGWSMA